MVNRRNFLRTVIGLGGAGVSGGAYAVGIEAGLRLSVVRRTVRHPTWPADAAPLTIALLTDIHAVRPWMTPERIAGIVARTNALAADLVLLGGDYVAAMAPRWHSGIVPVAEWAAPLAALAAPLGVHAVLGNHDWWTDAPAVRAGLEDVGIPVLENDVRRLSHRGAAFWLAGLGDQIAVRGENGGGARRRGPGRDDLPGTLAKADDEAAIVLLAHEPDIFAQVPERVALTLAGHTHGGQVYVPFVGRPIVPSRFGARYAYGHVVERGTNLVVGAGLGLSVLPARFLVPPEITVVTLTHGAVA